MKNQNRAAMVPILKGVSVFLMQVMIFFSYAQTGTGYSVQGTTPAGKMYTYPFQDPGLSFEERVNDLVSRLTLEEKVAQMLNAAPSIERLGVPAYDWWNEVLHGVARTPYKVTVYPQAIAMAATFDTAALKTMADYSATEGRAVYNKAIAEGKAGNRYIGLTYWTPNINIFRDPRWGRGQETYGEDPFLTAMLGRAFVHGLQGDDPKYFKAVACAKHYAVHSGPEPLRHNFNATPGSYDLWNTYLPAFRELVTNAHVGGVMCAYNAFNGQPCCGSDPLMTSILRVRWKFTGYVTSDCGGIDDFFKKHKTHANAEEAAADAVFHGTDVECGHDAYKSLVQAVKDGKITEAKINESIKRLFMVRFRLGMFDPRSMVKYAQVSESELESAEHKAHALKMARESIVLLKNENNTLPLSKKLKKIAMIGPNADNAMAVLGNYNGTPSKIVTALEGIKNKLGNDVEVIYEKAINYTNDSLPQNKTGHIVKTDMTALKDRVKDVDAIIYVGGISPQLEGESMRVDYPGFKGGDRTSILLPAIQTDLLKALKTTGKPVVFVMMTGSAIAIPWEAQNLPAIVNAWYGGQEAGTAIADVLFGDYNPSGRLPVTFYKSDKDLPDFSDYSMNNRTYRYFKGDPLYGFGYGLSYTTFVFSALKVPDTITKGQHVPVSVVVKNTGKTDGDEIVQLYVSGNGKATPIRSLKGFQRISLKAGESKEVNFTLTPDDMSVMDDNGMAQQFTGSITIAVGGAQPNPETLTAQKAVQREIPVR